MKKILYIVSTLKRCGPINQLSYIIKYLDKTLYEPVVLTLSSESTDDSMESYFVNTLHVRVETLGLSRIQGVFFAKSYVEKFIKDNNIDLVHSQGIRADGIMSNIDIPRVATLRNYPYYDYPMTYGKIQGLIMAKKHLNSLKKINHAVVVSKSISLMLEKMNSYKIDYIRNGIDIEKFQNLDKIKLRKKLGIHEHDKVFISVGDLSNRKDPLTIIKSFRKINIKNSKLIFLGDGPLKYECLNATREDERIQIRGKVNNVHEYLGASDYFVSASIAEGLPNAVLEAMACGLPCVLSNIPPHIEIHEIKKDSSLLFKTKNLQNLSEQLRKIVNQDYETMSKASKEIVFKSLSAEIMSQNYQKIYNKLLI